MKQAINYSDVQGLLRFGYGRLNEACFLLLRIEDSAAARSWLGRVPVATAQRLDPQPATAIQIAFTAQGLKALDVPEDIIEGFSAEFISGMGEMNRSRRLGDIGDSAPSKWRWGGQSVEPHILVMLFAEAGELDSLKATSIAEVSASGLRLLKCLETEQLDGYEPFGFRDGLSQPAIDWDGEAADNGADKLEYGNFIALGEFLLGHRNEYGKYTDRPLIDSRRDPKGELMEAQDQPGKKDVAFNGTYLVFRQLRQDVRGFWRFLDEQANSNAEARKALAEAMVGRTLDGKPLVPTTDRRIPGVGAEPEDALNQFTFDSDPKGTSCPLGAHIRRSNPRNADLPQGTKGLFSRLIRMLGLGRTNSSDLIASTRFHRIVRRGRDYGTGLTLEAALQPEPPGDDERGLHFICLNANIARQFEFVQTAWINGTKFNGLSEESDPLLGNREPIPGCPVTNTFSIPREEGVRRRISDVPQFVTVRGGAYFFLPSLSALRYFANGS